MIKTFNGRNNSKFDRPTTNFKDKRYVEDRRTASKEWRDIDKFRPNAKKFGPNALVQWRDAFTDMPNAVGGGRNAFNSKRNAGKKRREVQKRWREVSFFRRGVKKLGRNAITSKLPALSFSLSNFLFCVCLAHARRRGLGTLAATGVALKIVPLLQIKERNTDKNGREVQKRWRGVSFFRRDAKKLRRNAIDLRLSALSFSLATILFCVCLAHAGPRGIGNPAAAGVALSADSIKSLQIGDTIPNALWDLPLQMVKVGQEGRTTVTLNDYKGKLIILDFWATWCKSCLLTMPKMHNLQQKFSRDVSLIPSTYEPADKIIPFLKIPSDSSLAAVKKNFQGIVNGSMLNKFFPHQSLPYLVVINQQGKVAALTEPLSVNENTLREFLTDSTKTLYPKKEKLEKPLLGNQAIESTKPVYYSLLTGFLENYMFPTGVKVDSLSGTKWHYYINKPILQLYALAYKSALPRTPNKRILLVENPQKYEYSYRRSTSFSTRNQSYSYEAVLPLSMDEEMTKIKMVDDLNYHLGLHAKTVKMKMDCLILKSYQPKTEPKSVGTFALVVKGKKRKPIDDKVHDETNDSTYFRNAPTRILGGLIETIYPQINEGHILPAVINELPKKGNVNLYFSKAIHSIDDLIAVLKSQGVEACLESREMEFFILSEQSIGDKLPELRLTPIGYVAKN